MTWGVNQIIVISGHCEQGLENLRRCLTLGVLFRLVTHETKDKVMRCGGNQLRSDRAGEEVRVVINRILETSGTVVRKNLEIDIPGVAVRAKVKLFEVVHLHQIVVAVGVEISAGSASIALVDIVRSGKA